VSDKYKNQNHIRVSSAHSIEDDQTRPANGVNIPLSKGDYYLGITVRGDQPKDIEVLGFDYSGTVKEDDRINFNPECPTLLDLLVTIPLSPSKIRLRKFVKIFMEADEYFTESADNDQ